MNRIRLALFALAVALGMLALVGAQDGAEKLSQSTRSTYAAIAAEE